MQGTLLVSLDFELYWGVQDKRTTSDYGSNLLGARKAIPKLLDLFSRYGIHASWATVGFLFGENEEDLQLFLPPVDERPTYDNPLRSSYRCFANYKSDDESQYLYAPTLIDLISRQDGQEIASHTFSHYYCRELGQTVDQFSADMRAALAIAESKGYQLRSMVFPRNQTNPEHNQVLRDLGFSSYRDEENDWIHQRVHNEKLLRLLRLIDVYLPLTGQGGYIPRVEDGLVNLIGSRMYKPYFKPLCFLEWLKIRRIKSQMRHAAKKGLTFHLWWHPHNVGTRTEFHLKQLEQIFSYYEKMRDKYQMRSLNMMEAAQEALKG